MNYDFRRIEDSAGKLWEKHRVVEKSIAYEPQKRVFSFLEGPPTANAPPGIHHVLCRVFKDLFCRFKYMQGYTVPRKGGWDCHGLPVEVQVEKRLKLSTKKDVVKYGIKNFNLMCREDVFSFIEEWTKLTKKMAFWIDLENPYMTLDNNYIESVWWSLKELYDKKLLYEGHKVVPYCTRCGTPLSSHEVALGYRDVREDTVAVLFKLKEKDLYLLVWTTTPWTLPANLAVAVHPDINYAVVESQGKKIVVAKERVGKYFRNAKIVEEMKGNALEGLEYEPLFDYYAGKLKKKAFVIITAPFVNTEEGTGLVHQAPAFGEEDYEICKEKGIDFVQPINEEGKFTGEVNDFEGKYVKDADPDIIKKLEKEGRLFGVEKYTHSYPFCWRCGTPLIYYAMKSWFIRVSRFRKKLLELNRKINWYPGNIKDGRFGNWLEGAKDWALSRKKFWGTPLPIWRCGCGKEAVIGSVKELREKGVNVPKELDLHRPVIDEIRVRCECGKQMSRVDDVIDCWYDSGAAAFAQFHYPFENKELFKKRFPYDFIAEAVDQTRGWFYTLHVLGALLFDKPAYLNCVCAGHVVDDKGEKMSKSKGNVINPWEAFDKVGVDVVRVHFCSSEVGSEKRFGYESLKESTLPFFTILWNVTNFVKEFTENQKPQLSGKNLRAEDKWLISKTNSLIKKVTKELELHNYNTCISEIKSFVNEDISRWYIKLVRERAQEKDEALAYTFGYAISNLTKLLAPFAPYVTEEIYQSIAKEKEESVHLTRWPKPGEIDEKLEKDMAAARNIVQALLSAREELKLGVRWPLARAVVSGVNVKELSEIIAVQTNVKRVEFKKEFSGKGYVEAEFPGGKVCLDRALTPELEQEGFARELTRQIQEMRKKAGLKKQDRIQLAVATSYELGRFSEQLKEKVGASQLLVTREKKGKFKNEKTVSIRGKEFWVGF